MTLMIDHTLNIRFRGSTRGSFRNFYRETSGGTRLTALENKTIRCLDPQTKGCRFEKARVGNFVSKLGRANT